MVEIDGAQVYVGAATPVEHRLHGAHVFGVYLDTKQATRGRTISEECARTKFIVKIDLVQKILETTD